MSASGQKSLFPDAQSGALNATAPISRKARKAVPAEKEPVLVSLCFLGVPCRWHGRPAKRRDALLAKLKEKYVLVPICPEQLGGTGLPSFNFHNPGSHVVLLV